MSKVTTPHRVAFYSHRFYVTLACEWLLLMIVLLQIQKLDSSCSFYSRVAFYSHRFYATLACEWLLLMIVLLQSQKLDSL